MFATAGVAHKPVCSTPPTPARHGAHSAAARLRGMSVVDALARATRFWRRPSKRKRPNRPPQATGCSQHRWRCDVQRGVGRRRYWASKRGGDLACCRSERSSTFYAAVKTGANKGATGVYISHDTGATWTPIFTSANSNGIITSGGDQTVITLAAGPHGSVAIAVSDLGHGATIPSLAGVFLSSNQGGTWNQVTAAPNVVAGGQTPVNLHIAIDPTNSNIIYLSGDAHETCDVSPPTSLCTVQVYRLNYNAVGNSSTATQPDVRRNICEQLPRCEYGTRGLAFDHLRPGRQFDPLQRRWHLSFARTRKATVPGRASTAI